MKKVIGLLALTIVASNACLGLFMLLSMILLGSGASISLLKTIDIAAVTDIGTMLAIWYSYHKGYIGRKDFSTHISRSQSLYALILFLLMFILVMVFSSYVHLPDSMDAINIDIHSPIIFVSFVITGPILEEIFFRGIITKLLLKTYSPTKAIIVSAAIFSIIHLNPAQMPGAFAFGLLLGWIYYKTGSVVLGIVIHIANNLIAVLSAIYLGENWEFNNGTAAIILVAASLAILPFAIKGAKVAFAKRAEEVK